MNDRPLVQLQDESRERQPLPEDTRLKDGAPLYHVFLENPDAHVVNAHEVQTAKGELEKRIKQNRETVLQCQGKTREEALAILDSIGQNPRPGAELKAA